MRYIYAVYYDGITASIRSKYVHTLFTFYSQYLTFFEQIFQLLFTRLIVESHNSYKYKYSQFTDCGKTCHQRTHDWSQWKSYHLCRRSFERIAATRIIHLYRRKVNRPVLIWSTMLKRITAQVRRNQNRTHANIVGTHRIRHTKHTYLHYPCECWLFVRFGWHSMYVMWIVPSMYWYVERFRYFDGLIM